MKSKKIISFVFCVMLFHFTNAQMAPQDTSEGFTSPSDTLETASGQSKRHSPLKAAVLSAILPGAGQVYNKKYWKVPIVYAGLAGLGTWVGLNAKNLRGFTDAYKVELAGGVGEYKGFTGENQLSTKRDDAKRSLDLSIILTTVFYALNIVDATVDAHLFDYSITEDLSVKLEPNFSQYEVMNMNQSSIGLSLKLDFHKTKNY